MLILPFTTHNLFNLIYLQFLNLTIICVTFFLFGKQILKLSSTKRQPSINSWHFLIQSSIKIQNNIIKQLTISILLKHTIILIRILIFMLINLFKFKLIQILIIPRHNFRLI